MRDDSNFLEPFLPDGGCAKLRQVRKPSYYPGKVLGVLLRSSEVLWYNVENGIRCHPGAARIWTKKILILILSLFSFIGVITLCYGYILSVYEQHPPVAGYLKAGENVGSAPQNLTIMNLMELEKLELFCRAMENCLAEAVRQFLTEPVVVMENTKMILECNGTRKVYLSGKGGTFIEVNCTGGQMVYEVKEANSKVLMARLGQRPLPLNPANILKVYRKLAFHNGSEELQKCLNKTLEEFPKEPMVVQDNAKLKVWCGEKNVTFISGAGQNEITVSIDGRGEVQFQVKGQWWARLVRFFTRGRVH